MSFSFDDIKQQLREEGKLQESGANLNARLSALDGRITSLEGGYGFSLTLTRRHLVSLAPHSSLPSTFLIPFPISGKVTHLAYGVREGSFPKHLTSINIYVQDKNGGTTAYTLEPSTKSTQGTLFITPSIEVAQGDILTVYGEAFMGDEDDQQDSTKYPSTLSCVCLKVEEEPEILSINRSIL